MSKSRSRSYSFHSLLELEGAFWSYASVYARKLQCFLCKRILKKSSVPEMISDFFQQKITEVWYSLYENRMVSLELTVFNLSGVQGYPSTRVVRSSKFHFIVSLNFPPNNYHTSPRSDTNNKRSTTNMFSMQPAACICRIWYLLVML